MADKTMTLKQRYAEPLSRERARIGRRIFFVYLALYGLFVLAHVAWPQLTRYPVGGVGLGADCLCCFNGGNLCGGLALSSVV